MEKVNFGYSLKNIPTPDEKSYKLQLVEKIEDLIKKMRWRALFFLGKCNNNDNNREEDNHNMGARYGLKSPKCPPQVKELAAFENDLIRLIKVIKFQKVNNAFQKKIADDLKKIRSSKKTLTPADKTTNMYRLEKHEYEHLLSNAITKSYKKTNEKTNWEINKTGIKYAKKAGIIDRIEINGKGNSFITLKDHKENFQNHPTTRLINPAKNEIGRISKAILDKINIALCRKNNE